MGAEPLRRSSIVSYCSEHDLVGEDKEDLLYHVQKMDAWHVKRLAEKNKPKTKAPSVKRPLRPRR